MHLSIKIDYSKIYTSVSHNNAPLNKLLKNTSLVHLKNAPLITFFYFFFPTSCAKSQLIILAGNITSIKYAVQLQPQAISPLQYGRGRNGPIIRPHHTHALGPSPARFFSNMQRHTLNVLLLKKRTSTSSKKRYALSFSREDRYRGGTQLSS